MPHGLGVTVPRGQKWPIGHSSEHVGPLCSASEYELPYILRSTGKAIAKDLGPPQWRARWFPDEPVVGRNRQRLLARAGKVQVPYLIDPNTGTELFESADILDYLDRTYAKHT